MDRQKITHIHKGVQNLDEFRERLINNEIEDAIIIYGDGVDDFGYVPLTDSYLTNLNTLIDITKHAILSSWCGLDEEDEEA